MPIIAPIAAAAVGLYQTIAGGINANKARKALQNQITPTVAPNKAVNDYYQMALNKYNAGPYNSLEFQNNKRSAEMALGAGINSAQNRRLGVQTAGAFAQQYQNNIFKAGALAEQNQNRNFAQLGQATGAKYRDDQYGFNINSMLPYNKRRELLNAEAVGFTEQQNAGISNMSSAFNDGASILYSQKKSGLNFWGNQYKTPSSGGGSGGGGEWAV